LKMQLDTTTQSEEEEAVLESDEEVELDDEGASDSVDRSKQNKFTEMRRDGTLPDFAKKYFDICII